MTILRPYQKDLFDKIHQAFKSGIKHVIAQLGTGGGKTVIFTFIAKKVAEKNKKVLIMTNRTELLFQAGGSCKKIGLNAFYIQAGAKAVNTNFPVYVAMSQTLRRRIDLDYWKNFIKSIDLVIIDECHLQDFNFLFESGLLDDKHVLGVSATPKRSGRMRQLAFDYEKIINGISVKELIDQGYLVNDDYYGCDAPDLSGVTFNYLKGDYQENQMFAKYNSAKRYKGVVKNYSKYVPNTKTLCFCVNIEHAIKTTIEFIEAGFNAKFIVSGISHPKLKDNATDGEKARYEERLRAYNVYKDNFKALSGPRDEIINGFKNNEFTHLINAAILTTGFDCPDIETIIINRATISTTLLLQIIGRGSRPWENKTHFNILDFGTNCSRLGYYNETRGWGLWHNTIEGEGLPPIKDCGIDAKGKPIINNNRGGCGRMIMAGYNICPFCGFKYPDKKIDDIDLGLMISGGADNNIKAPAKKPLKQMTPQELMTYFKFKRHKSPWLWRQLHYRGGADEIMKFGIMYNWDIKTVNKAISYCQQI